MRTIAIIPAYNEEVAIAFIVKRALKYVDRVIVVDDGSVDRTSQRARDAGAHVIKHYNNLGKGVSLKDAFAEVKGFDIVVTIDGDGQHNPDEMLEIMRPIREGRADLVNGSRYLNGFDESTPAYRRIGQKVLNIATNVTSGTHVTDSQSGFRAFSGKRVHCFRFRDTGFGIESEMLADAAENNLRIVEVPITVRYDVVNSSTKGPVTHGVGVLFKIIVDKIVRTFRR
ncbi:glycosyltransferase family 2 protein [Methanobrevibacter sp.]|uniref:glycosyltransferase family 2 protein n=1 Tax=Methanobrevibacter sp. TaxID=66852 RepID=UPI00388DA07A